MAARAGTNVATGAALEAGGRAVAPIVGRVLGAGARVVGAVRDLPQRAEVMASNLLRQSAGDRLPAQINELRAAPAGMTPAQILAPTNSPVTQQLLQQSGQLDANFTSGVAARQTKQVVNNLRKLAGATTVTEGRQAARAGQNALNDRLVPKLENALARANEGAAIPGLTAEAAALRGQAAGAVQDVRRLTATAERAAGNPASQVPGQARVSNRFTYAGELGQRAERMAEDAAAASLKFGEAAAFREADLADLAAQGLKPLESAPVVQRIAARLNDPVVAGNKPLQAALKEVSDELTQWTNNRGVISAEALNNIRKNASELVGKAMGGTGDPKAQKKLAAKVLSQITPMVSEAIEEAGGKGYRQYLKSYSEGMRQIGERKMGAELLRLFEKPASQQSFIDIVDGNNPKAVEKIFGPGNDDLKEQMSPSAMTMLREASDLLKTNRAVTDQATAGTKAFEQLLRDNMAAWRIPNQLNPVIAPANKVLQVVSDRLNRKVLRQLTAASQDGRTMLQAIEVLPAVERSAVLRVLNDRSVMTPAVARALTGIGTNALAPETSNELAR
jgi:hypothetical protein